MGVDEDEKCLPTYFQHVEMDFHDDMYTTPKPRASTPESSKEHASEDGDGDGDG